MNVYTICEGIDQESSFDVNLIHERLLPEVAFDAMYEKAKAAVTETGEYLTCENVANRMCELYGFKILEPVFVRNVDMEPARTKEPHETNEGVFEETSRLAGSFSEAMDMFYVDVMRDAAEHLDKELVDLLETNRKK